MWILSSWRNVAMEIGKQSSFCGLMKERRRATEFVQPMREHE